MTRPFPVPDAFRRAGSEPARVAWLDGLPSRAAGLADRWGLTPDGDPMFGFLSVVWPVRGPDGRRLVLKIHEDTAGTDGERLALEAARGPALVELVASDPERRALLLQRLDRTRSLGTVADVDEACAVIGGLVAAISGHPAPGGMRSMADELDRLHVSITAMLDRTPEVLPRAVADRALEACTDLSRRLRAAPGAAPLVHGDLHFENVLHTLPGEPARWVAIDPLPAAGYSEWEVTASLRNRWSDAAATGDPERALRRRVDIIVERAGLDAARAVAIAQAVAVDNLLWLSRSAAEVHPVVRGFVPPYEIISRWAP